MGILKKIFGAVFSLLAAIAGLVGLGKKDNYFLDLSPDEAAQKTVAVSQKVVAKTSEAANSIAPAQVSQKSKTDDQADKAKQEKLAAREVAKEAKEESKRIEAEQAAAKKAGEAAIAAAQAEAVKKMGYAEIARTPTPTMRTRRPGPSIDRFKDLVKEMKA